MADFNAEQVERAVRLLDNLPGAAQKAMARAMNRAIEGARTTTAKEIRKRYKVNSAQIKATMRMTKATASRLCAEAKSKGPRLSLYQFGPEPNQPGTGGRFSGYGMTRPPLRVSVLRAGGKKGRKIIPGAFIFDSPEGNRLIGIRVGEKRANTRGKRKGRMAQRIRVLYTAAVPQMMGEAGIIEKVDAVAQKRLDDRLDHEIDRALEQASK